MSFDLNDPTGEHVGEGIIALDKEGRLVGTFEQRTKAGRFIQSFKVRLDRK